MLWPQLYYFLFMLNGRGVSEHRYDQRAPHKHTYFLFTFNLERKKWDSSTRLYSIWIGSFNSLFFFVFFSLHKMHTIVGPVHLPLCRHSPCVCAMRVEGERTSEPERVSERELENILLIIAFHSR